MAGETFLRGAFILTLAGMFVKVLGSVSRIFISRVLGGEGVGLYQMAYPIYLLITSISSAGIPVAISILISERLALGDSKGAKKTFKISLLLMVVTGLFFSLLLYFGAGWLVEHDIVRDGRAYWALVALAPAVFFATILASFRGYFQGFHQMMPTAVSQIIEQFVRVVTMIGLSWLLLSYGLEYAAAGAAFGASPGSFVGLLVLLVFYFKQKKAAIANEVDLPANESESLKTGQLAKRLVQLAVPVSLANIMVPLVSSIDALIVPIRLEAAGFAIKEATTLFGYLTGMALPLVMMATIPTASLALSIVPAVSEAHALNDRLLLSARINSGMRLTGMITIPCTLGMFVLAQPIAKMLYASPEASLSIAIMSIGIFFLGLHQVTTAVLQGLSRAGVPMLNMALSAVVKVVFAWIFTALPLWNISGAAWASVLDFALAAILNLIFLYRYTGFVLDYASLTKLFTAGIAMGGCAYAIYQVFSTAFGNSISTLLAISVGGAVYCIMLLLLGLVRKSEMEKLPVVGIKLAKILSRLKLLKD